MLELAEYMVERLKQLEAIYGPPERDQSAQINPHTSIFELASSGPAFSNSLYTGVQRPKSSMSIPKARMRL